jgi:hypothetical protein
MSWEDSGLSSSLRHRWQMWLLVICAVTAVVMGIIGVFRNGDSLFAAVYPVKSAHWGVAEAPKRALPCELGHVRSVYAFEGHDDSRHLNHVFACATSCLTASCSHLWMKQKTW